MTEFLTEFSWVRKASQIGQQKDQGLYIREEDKMIVNQAKLNPKSEDENLASELQEERNAPHFIYFRGQAI